MLEDSAGLRQERAYKTRTFRMGYDRRSVWNRGSVLEIIFERHTCADRV